MSEYKKSQEYKNSQAKYWKTIKGIVTMMYSMQKKSSRERGHEPPQYTKQEFHNWLISQPNFNKLYNNWIESNYNKWLKPSADRIENDKGYSFSNIRLMTWKENSDLGRFNRKIRKKRLGVS